MVENIFRFWGKIKPHEKIHPADRDVFDRVGRRGHGMDLRCLPHCFVGPLKTARVVLLFLSPGLDKHDLKDARTKEGRERYAKARKGKLPLRSQDEHPTSHKWLRQRTKAFGVEFENLRSKVAVLNIGAYHSKRFNDYPLLAALPSSRVSLDWAQKKLFPQAIRGERVVICLRASHFWGLAEGTKNGLLFAPSVTRGGHMKKKTRKQKEMRNDIARAVKAIIRKK